MYMVYSGRILPDMPYSALLGSTVDTCYCQSTSRWVLFPCSAQCLVLSVVHGMRQSRNFRISTFSRGNRPRILRSIHVATADFPQLQFIKVVDISFVLQRLIPMVLVTMEIPQLRVDKVVDALFMPVVQTLPVKFAAELSTVVEAFGRESLKLTTDEGCWSKDVVLEPSLRTGAGLFFFKRGEESVPSPPEFSASSRHDRTVLACR